MKKLLLILLCLPMIGFGQDVNIFNSFKYIYVSPLKYQDVEVDMYGILNNTQKKLKKYGFTVISDGNFPDDAKLNPCLVVTCLISHPPRNPYGNYVNLVFEDCQNKTITTSSGSWGLGMTDKQNWKGAVRKALGFFKGYKHKYDGTVEKRIVIE
jgi:hypothetical protein